MSCEFRLITDNYAFQDNVDITATSSDPSFPVSNLTHPFRSKIWRSSGNFVISASNKYIDFNEGGPALGAILAEGSYTPDQLEAEIKSKLETAGALTYTVTYDTGTGLWTIAATGTFALLWDSGANTANSLGSSIGFDVSQDYTGAATYIGAAIAIHTEEAILFDLNTAEEVTSFAILFDGRLGSKLSLESVVTLQASATNVWTSPAVSQVLTFNEEVEAYTHFFATAQEYRYWRVKIVDPKNPELYVELAKVFFGKEITLDHGPERGYRFEFEDQTKIIENDYGYRFADIYPLRKSVSYNLALIPEADANTLADAYFRSGSSRPVLAVLDTFGDLFDTERQMIYGYMESSLKFGQRVLDSFDTEIKITEAL